jgi:hypothetical protein
MVALLTRTLGVICPSCDFLNVAGATRCLACGSATDGAAQPRSPVAAHPPAAQPTQAREPPASPTRPGGLGRSASLQTPVPAPVNPPAIRPGPPRTAPPPPSPAPGGVKFGLTVVAGPARGQRFKLNPNGSQLGRSRGVLLFPDDPFVSPLHATFFVRDGKLFVRDENSTSGVYASVTNAESLTPGSAFSAGLRLFRYGGAIEPQPPWNRVDLLVYGAPLPNNAIHYAVEEILLGYRTGRCLVTPGPALSIGQGRCDFSYPDDDTLAPRHCEMAPTPTGAMIRDLSGGLGTFVRVSRERSVKPGDRLRIGQQTIQVDMV